MVRSMIAGVCGSMAHLLLMSFKSWSGLLPSFQPYENLQATLHQITGSSVDPIVPWALSFLNGSTIVGVVFGQLYRWLPGSSGETKGAVYGVLGWLIMGILFFPMIGLGVFATATGLGIAPALFSLAMLLTYSVVLGSVYGALDRAGR
ncbi:DUF6789 family protein [Bradyrhizobium sp. STM 3843]|uniref:DUF6789 family protein n=1 Tax=Bradyrhizobium sp. STM 3843 TaxID=551947 RepID=UPI0005602239